LSTNVQKKMGIINKIIIAVVAASIYTPLLYLIVQSLDPNIESFQRIESGNWLMLIIYMFPISALAFLILSLALIGLLFYIPTWFNQKKIIRRVLLYTILGIVMVPFFNIIHGFDMTVQKDFFLYYALAPFTGTLLLCALLNRVLNR